MGILQDLGNYIWDRLPVYYTLRDTNKDNDPDAMRRGLLERYLEAFGYYQENEVREGINDYLDIVNPLLTEEKYLNYIAYSLGKPPDVFNNPEEYRTLLATILTVYKIKGTVRSYELFFELLGATILNITEYPDPVNYLRDGQTTYDGEDVRFDNGCKVCLGYDIAFGSPDNTPLSPVVFSKLREVVFFVEPIYMDLQNLIQLYFIDDSADFCGAEEVTITVKRSITHDTNQLYDDSENYDGGSTTSTQTLTSTCRDRSPGGIGAMEIEETFIVS